jgi:UDP-N-acetylglucosamine:LPS N-acetylglucosamine transferase
VIFLTGHNTRLYEEARSAANETGIPTAVLEFHNKMPELMNAVDLMVTKAGGLTTFEALARRLPLVLDNTIEPMPQEAPTMRMLVETGLAEMLNRPDDIVGIVDRMQLPVQRQTNLPGQYQLDLTDRAVFDIASSLLQLSGLDVESVPESQEKDAA